MKPRCPVSLAALVGLIFLAAGLARGVDAKAAGRPNILFLFADDQRADTIAALGNPVIQTPNLDRLARGGLAFTRAYMQGGMQGATCVPSRAMLLSGRNLFHIDEKLLRDETWPAAFGRAGYTTFMTGKWHNGGKSIGKSFQIARSVFAGGMGNPLQLELWNLVDGKLAEQHLAKEHAVAAFADQAIGFLQNHQAGPFFAYVPFDAPHDPHIVPPDFPLKYNPATIPLPPNFLPQHPWDNGEMTIRDEKLLPWPRTPEAVKAYLAEYYRYITYLDQQIGRILDALAASPHATNTIVVFSADSGVACGSHGLIGKQSVYEHSLRVPLLISGPGIPAGQRTEAMCYLFDVLPTLGKLCGVTGPTTSEGLDFSATLRNPLARARPQMLFAYRNVQRAVRDDRWKLIRYPQVDKTQLFDLQNDPQETINLAASPEHASRVKSLTSLLEQQQKEFGDAAPLTVATPQPAAWTPPKQRSAQPKSKPPLEKKSEDDL
ncbi:MAG: sulfatase-like hydrolase/transferase [Verrucomicrobia bacterium]|jgi:arylsulfatase A-like enzyme|nr:sulfatase-like hydrolase/transferase [Verrucomicrobiota bacterium]